VAEYASALRCIRGTGSRVIASASEAIQQRKKDLDCFVAYASLRKRFAFVAGNDDLVRPLPAAKSHRQHIAF
jgi:hypothetical protein